MSEKIVYFDPYEYSNWITGFDTRDPIMTKIDINYEILLR